MSKNLLGEVNQLLKEVGAKIEKSKEIAKLKGENFNIFSILGIETKENKTHSNFIISLLDPKGDHGLGSTFLKLFIETIFLEKETNTFLKQDSCNNNNTSAIDKLKLDEVEVKPEHSLGNIDWGKVEGGRVDILINDKDKNWAIFIENKINAGDQHQQMARYCNDTSFNNKTVFYLTLDGHEPSEDSVVTKEDLSKLVINRDYFLLSYKDDIKNWLEKCQKEVSDYPIIRETIKQYLILIKKLTGQLTTDKMSNEIFDLILKNIDAANEITYNIGKAKASVRQSIITTITERLKNEKEWEVMHSQDRKGYLLIFIRRPDWSQDLKYWFQIDPNGLTNLCTVIDKRKDRSISFCDKVKSIFDKDYYEYHGCLSTPIDIINMNDKFIKDYRKKTDENKNEFIDEIVNMILQYIDKFNDKANEVDVLLKGNS